MPVVYARPNRNGNDAKDFAEHGLAIHKAAMDLIDTMRAAKADLYHGRNYQSGQDRGDQSRDQAVMFHCIDEVLGIMKLAEEIAKAGGEG